jgi:hypothetical protein
MASKNAPAVPRRRYAEFCNKIGTKRTCLGRPRYVAVAYWRGGQVLREAKALAPSAWTWANGAKQSQKSNFLALANGRYRAPDPFLHVRHGFIFRRVAADSQKIELGDDAGKKLHLNLLRAMGYDVASIHAAGSAGIKALKADLRSGRAAG